MSIEVSGCGAEAAKEVHELTVLAYSAYAALDPPSGALSEDVDEVAAELDAHGGVLVRDGGVVVGSLRLQQRDGALHLRRVAVHPDRRGEGIARAMVDWCLAEARRCGVQRLTLGVRDQLPANRRVWEKLGFTVVAQHAFPPPSQWGWTEMERVLEP